jgi:hypothetical protein
MRNRYKLMEELRTRAYARTTAVELTRKLLFLRIIPSNFYWIYRLTLARILVVINIRGN